MNKSFSSFFLKYYKWIFTRFILIHPPSFVARPCDFTLPQILTPSYPLSIPLRSLHFPFSSSWAARSFSNFWYISHTCLMDSFIPRHFLALIRAITGAAPLTHRKAFGCPAFLLFLFLQFHALVPPVARRHTCPMHALAQELQARIIRHNCPAVPKEGRQERNKVLLAQKSRAVDGLSANRGRGRPSRVPPNNLYRCRVYRG